ncbi:MAG: GntP family permease [Clostridia bacterium]|nr:SLC13 family permease [Lachnospiraceae bacterium]NCB99662.1 GntP family permease [Clostridia bacterium]NCD01765.1 GntP family permease [Clostridia bacterium]
MLGVIGLIVAMILLVILAMKGIHILAIGLICSSVLALTSGMNIYTVLAESYMPGFTGFITSNFLVFLAGALFGKFMNDSHAADAIANWIVKKLGASKAVLAVVISCFVLAYGGVSVFVVGFTIFPIAISLYKEADIPRKYLPAAIGFGSVTFAMTCPGTPQIQNIIPGQTLGTDTMSGAVVGIIVGIFMFIVGYIWLSAMIKKEKAAGVHFVAKDGEETAQMNEEDMPNVALSFIPLIATIILMNALKLPAAVAIFAGIVLGVILLNKTYKPTMIAGTFSGGATSAISAIANTSAVVGFGAVVKTIPLFQTILDGLLKIPGPPLIGAALAVTIICGLTGSASGGLGIAIPLIGPTYVQMGVVPAALHRVASIASGALDSVPHNGYIVTLLNLCGETHKDAYMPLFWLTVVLPFISCAIAIALFQLFPMWP